MVSRSFTERFADRRKSVSKWAKQNFAASYEQLPGARAFTFHQYNAPQYSKTGQHKALVIGTTNSDGRSGTELIAWLEESRMQLGYTVEKKSGKNEFRLMMFADKGARFDEPFCWVVGMKTEGARARLEALVRYCFLMKGTATAVKDKLLDFGTHFPGACSNVASEMGRKTRKRILKEDALKMKEIKTNNTDTSASTPNGFYGVKICAQNVVNRVTVLSSPSPSPPPTGDAPRFTNLVPTIKTENHEHMIAHSHEQEGYVRQGHAGAHLGLVNEGRAVHWQYGKERRDLHNKLEELKMKLAMADRRAKKAEDDAAFWENRFQGMMRTLENGSGEGN